MMPVYSWILVPSELHVRPPVRTSGQLRLSLSIRDNRKAFDP